MPRRRDRASIQGFAADNRNDIEATGELAGMVGQLARQATDNQPVPRSLAESMHQAERLLKASQGELTTGHQIYLRAHADDDDRDRAPRHGSDRVEQGGDVVPNLRDNG